MKVFFRNVLPLLTIAVSSVLFLSGCDAFKNEDTSGTITLQGQVLNSETNNPVAGAVIRVSPYDKVYEADEDGLFIEELKIDSTTTLVVEASQTGFTSRSFEVLAIAGRTVEVPVFRLVQFGDEIQVSGFAANILLQRTS